AMQVKLLRVLQECEFERVGGIKTISVDVRLVTATNRDLKSKVAEGTFRDDLYYRLNVVPIMLVPLRDRAGDIPELAEFFVDKFNKRLKKSVTGVTAEALHRLQQYHWPGNIRELENIIERAILFADGSQIVEPDLSPEVLAQTDGGQPGGVGSSVQSVAEHVEVPLGSEGLKQQVKAATSRLERELIVRALKQTGGNVTHAARLLKISRKGLQLKMKELELRNSG
ncbi:MAG: sigma-54-dependent Fis family transcriptional regulator, partial [Deltaproteobacteria bacterium]